MTHVKTNIRAFLREFPRMRRLATAGNVIVVESKGQSFVFHRRQAGAGVGVLGCMIGRAKLGKLRNGPAIPLEEWGTLAQ